MPPAALIEVTDLRKSFDGVKALKGASFAVGKREFHALLGENGAGKSTLIKLVTGVYPASGGHIHWRGHPVTVGSPQHARELGIGVVHQEETLLPELSVAENFTLGQSSQGLFGWVPWYEVEAHVREALREVHLSIDPGTPVSKLSVAERKRVAIMRTLALDPDLIILDEPTAALTSDEVGRLMELLASLKRNGKAILYVTHRLQEIQGLVDRVTVLKDGNQQATLDRHEATPSKIVSLMVGRAVQDIFPPPAGEVGAEVLSVGDLRKEGAFEAVSFQVRSGEIVGLVGLDGHGHFRVARALYGSPPADHGEIRVLGGPVAVSGPRSAIAAGIGFVSDDRINEGLLTNLTVRENLGLAVLSRWARRGVIRRADEVRGAAQLKNLLGVKAASMESPIETLSGGNQQKVVLARWVAAGVRILVLLDPTAGVDVGARVEIYRVLREMTENSAGLVVATSDLAEALGLCDRIYVFYQGRAVREFHRKDFSEQAILAAMTGHIEVAA